MATWKELMPLIVRQMIGDVSLTPQYSDASLQSMICVAGIMTTRELDFRYPYQIDAITIDISPDPVSVGDHDFLGLVCLKATVFIADGEYRNAARMAISQRDGPSHIDTKGIAENLKTISLAKAKVYEDAKIHYEVGDGSLGKAILGPYNAFLSLYSNNMSALNTGSNRDDTASFFSG
jgi:hypothetical protein